MIGLVCAYCAHKLVEGAAHCLHCGAPAHAKETKGEQPIAKPPPQQPESSESAPAEEESRTSWLMWLVIGLLGFMALVTVIVLAGQFMSGPAPATDPVTALPDRLQSAATCAVLSQAQAECVVAAADPLVREGLTGARDLSFTATLVPQGQLAAIVAEWRRQGGKIIATGTVFVDVSPSGGVRYANTATGLRIETVTFASEMSARTFVMRAGLARQPL